MNELFNEYFASDLAIFSLMMAGKQKLTDKTLRELAKDRGIFYSMHNNRTELIDVMSALPFDYHDLNSLVEKGKTNGRPEKTTSVTIDADLSNEEIKKVMEEYAGEVGLTEKISHYKNNDKFTVDVEYEEYDYSKTQLIQKQQHRASIVFKKENGKTVIRIPATEKAKNIAQKLTSKIEGHRKKELKKEIVEISDFPAKERTDFFTQLISTLPGFQIRDVNSLKVASTIKKVDTNLNLDDEEEDLEIEIAEKEMIGVVKKMAISGQNLTASDEYQQLRSKGFFITSVSWSAEQTSLPQDIIYFEATFNDGEGGTGFKYGIKGKRKYQEGIHLKTLLPLEDHEKEPLFNILEESSKKIMRSIRSTIEAKKSSGDDNE